MASAPSGRRRVLDNMYFDGNRPVDLRAQMFMRTASPNWHAPNLHGAVPPIRAIRSNLGSPCRKCWRSSAGCRQRRCGPSMLGVGRPPRSPGNPLQRRENDRLHRHAFRDRRIETACWSRRTVTDLRIGGPEIDDEPRRRTRCSIACASTSARAVQRRRDSPDFQRCSRPNGERQSARRRLPRSKDRPRRWRSAAGQAKKGCNKNKPSRWKKLHALIGPSS